MISEILAPNKLELKDEHLDYHELPPIVTEEANDQIDLPN